MPTLRTWRSAPAAGRRRRPGTGALLAERPLGGEPAWLGEGQYRDEVRPFEVLDTQGWVALKAGRVAEARALLDRAYALFPFDERTPYHSGQAAEAAPDPEAAWRAYVEAMEVRGDVPGLVEALERVAVDRQKFAAGVPLQRTVARARGVVAFEEVTDAAGLAEAAGGHVAWGDHDGDGYPDLLIGGCQLWRNRGDGTLEDVTWLAGVRVLDGWGCAWADYDRDGDRDLVVCAGGRPRLFRNLLVESAGGKAPAGRAWIEVSLTGSDCNRAAIGARITVTAGERHFLREVQGGFGTTCQNELVQHVGLGAWTGAVRWPCGRRQTVRAAPGTRVAVREE